nr:hypothetical protein [Tanacetum cinerariifolium]
DERERVKREATRAGGPAGGPVIAPMARECSFAGFIKCGPTQFYGIEGVVRLVRWFEKMENTFEISECVEGRKVKFATATLHGRALTWWNSQVTTLGREVANGRPQAKVKQMMTDEFCPTKEVQRLEDELRHLKLRDMNIAAYAERFNDLALLCPDAVLNEKKKVELYIKGLLEIIKVFGLVSYSSTIFKLWRALIEMASSTSVTLRSNSGLVCPRILSRAAIRDERERVRREATRAGGPAGGPVTAPMARECSFAGFMKCGPTQFYGIEGAVGLVRWFEKMENTFEIIECAEGRKVKFATATLHGRALTWWNFHVATLGREVANGRPRAEVKQMMTDEFYPTKEVQRLEDELRHLKLRDMNIAAYAERFNDLALLCPDAVPNEKKKVELYIKGLLEIIKGETTSSRPVTLNEVVRMAHALMEQKIQAKNERIAKGLKRKWENNNQGKNNNNNNSHNRGNYRNNNHHNQNNNRRQNNARALNTTQNAGANQYGVAPKCNRCGRCHFDQCPLKFENCGRIGHKAKDCQSRNVATGAAVQPFIVCYRCGERGHKSFECPKKAD